MSVFDVVLTIVNIILTVVSAVGAYKSVMYYKKSHNLTVYAQTNKALIEIEKMIIKLPEALATSNRGRRNKKGYSKDLCLVCLFRVSDTIKFDTIKFL